MARIRILRVLEYEGEEELVWNTLRSGGVPANGESPNWGSAGNHVKIRSGLVGFPDYSDWKYKEEDGHGS
jgi:hypothetical protein